MAVSRSLRFQILRRDNHTCRYCGRSAPEVKLTVDHVNPETLGGGDDPSNLVTACADCNGGKSATPPDAALVAQVNDDAIRWARARHLATEQALAEFEQRTTLREQFRSHWNQWEIGGRALTLPQDWAQTVDRFLALGLPMPILLEAVGVAMARKIRADNVFNYVCGVAWNKLREIEAQAAALLGQPAEQDCDHMARPAAQLAGDLLNQVSDQFGDEYLADALGEVQAEGIPPAEQLVEAIRRVVDQLMMDVSGFELAVDLAHLEWLVSPEFRQRINSDPDLTGQARSRRIVDEAANELAVQRLEALSEEERTCWMRAAAAHHQDPGWESFRFAAAWAQRRAESGSLPHRICGMPTGDGLVCPERSTVRLTFENCPICAAECGGHELCGEHSQAAADGKVAGPDNTPVSVAQMTEIDQNNPWR